MNVVPETPGICHDVPSRGDAPRLPEGSATMEAYAVTEHAIIGTTHGNVYFDQNTFTNLVKWADYTASGVLGDDDFVKFGEDGIYPLIIVKEYETTITYKFDPFEFEKAMEKARKALEPAEEY